MTAVSGQPESATEKPVAPDKAKLDAKPVLVPYLVVVASLLPLSVVYLFDLWAHRPHYFLMPLAVIVAVVLLIMRMPPKVGESIGRSRSATLLLGVGLVSGVLGTLLVSPWLAYAGFLAIGSSLLTRIPDKYAASTLLPVIVPLMVLLQPPIGFDFDTVNGDLAMIAAVKSTAASLGSDLLDLLKVTHNRNITMLQLPDFELDVTKLGNGLHSVFSLLIIASIFVAIRRRPFFRGLLLLISSVFWAICILALHIAVICIGFEWFEQDYQTGSSGAILSAGLFVIAVVLILATDQLIGFLFGPVDMTAIDESASQQATIAKVWNRFFAGDTQSEAQFDDERRYSRAKPISATAHKFVWFSAIVLALCLLLQLVDIVRAVSLASGVPDADDITVTEQKVLDQQIGDWSSTVYEQKEQDDGELLITNWSFENSEGVTAHVVVTRPLDGWNNLLLEYRRQGWKLLSRDNLNAAPGSSDDEPAWPFVRATFRKPFGQSCEVLFCNIDSSGQPFAIPVTWSDPGSFFSRMVARLGNRVRARLIAGGATQIQAECISEETLSDETRMQVRELFLSARMQFKKTLDSAD